MQIPGYALYLDMSVRVFPQEFSIWISKLNKGNFLPQCGWTSPNPLKPEWRNKMVGEGRIGAHSFSLSLCLTVRAKTSVFCPQCSWHSGLTGVYTMGSIALRLLNCMKSFPRFPACRWKIIGLFSLLSQHEPAPHNQSFSLSKLLVGFMFFEKPV